MGCAYIIEVLKIIKLYIDVDCSFFLNEANFVYLNQNLKSDCQSNNNYNSDIGHAKITRSLLEEMIRGTL